MTVLKAPLLSLGAHGTLGDAITLRRRRRTTIAETKPVPSDPQSYLQLLQRWRYQDAFYYWATLSTAQKAVYKALGNQTNNTTIGAFLKEYLLNPPDLEADWRMDSIVGGKVIDFSGNNVDLDAFGVGTMKAPLGNALTFDGVNDWLRNAASELNLPGPLTIEIILFLKSAAVGEYPRLFTKHAAGAGWIFQIHENPRVHFRPFPGGVRARISSPLNSIPLSQWSYVAGLWDGSNARASVNYSHYLGEAGAGDIPASNVIGLIGGTGGVVGDHLDGYMTHMWVWNRALSEAQREYHARRYGIAA